MTDTLSPEDRRSTMQAVGSSGTAIERKLWAMLAGMRLAGWKKNVTEVVGKPDVLFSEERLAIFVDGCFWHGCPHCNRSTPQTNPDYWRTKIQRNIARDKAVNRELRESGWRVLRVWGHQIRNPCERQRIRSRIRLLLDTHDDDSNTADERHDSF